MNRPRKAGLRHPLLLYRRVMDRLWVSTLILGIILLAAWGWTWISSTRWFVGQENDWLGVAAGVLLAFSVFAYFARLMAYVQPRRDHLGLVTPFLHLRISYRRIRSVHPVDFQQLFPPNEASWAQRRLLEPFYGKTAVVVELTDYPLPRRMLRFFLAPQMFSHRSKGLVLLVPDWMTFSTEIDSFTGSWLQSQGPRRAAPGRLR
jgi:hypothetical protein